MGRDVSRVMGLLGVLDLGADYVLDLGREWRRHDAYIGFLRI